MATITLRRAKGASLTHDEVDDNFEQINNELIALAAGTVAEGDGITVTTGNTINIDIGKLPTAP